MNTTPHRRYRTLKRILVTALVLIFIFAVYFLAAIHLSTPEIADRSIERSEPKTVAPGLLKMNNSWLKKSNSGLWEMYIEGDGFERGVTVGKLTKQLAEVQEMIFVNQIKELVPSEGYLNFLKYFIAYFNRKVPEHITKEYLDEIYGVSLSAYDYYDRMAPKYYRILNYHSAHDIGHALQDKNMTVGCTSFGVWNSKTKDGKMLIGRNFDFFAGDAFAVNKIVCFTKPAKGNKFMYVTWSGFTGVVSGMNDKGLTVTINAAKSEIPKSAATPISILAKEILQYAGNISEAYAIAQTRQTFVSESILIGSTADKGAAIIEKTPGKTNLYSEKGDQLICSNHFMSDKFKDDYINNKNIVESSSLYREYRMKQLLAATPVFTPEDVAGVLRNQKGINGKEIGLTNEKGINQLIAHHAVIFKPEDGLVWVSTAPYQCGQFVCYDLNKIFKEAPGLNENKEIKEEDKTIAADAFLSSDKYRNFILFKKIKNYLQFCTKSRFNLVTQDNIIAAFVKSNPDSYLTYQVLGDYYTKVKDKKQAAAYYNLALTKEIATVKEERKIKESIAALENKK